MAEGKKEEVLINAASGTRRFDKVLDSLDAERGISSYSIVANIDGQEYKEPLGEYTKQKFPGTRQGRRPKWDDDTNQYIIKRSDGTVWTQTDVNELVKELSLTYPSWHPKRGDTITSSNLKSFGDAFINHPIFVTYLDEGEARLDPNARVDKFKEDALRGQRAFMDESLDTVRSAEVEYIIRNPQVSQEREEKKREESELAYDYYNGMKTDPDRMRKILYLFGVDMDENASTSALRTAVFKKQSDSVGRDQGEVNQKLFVRYAELEPDMLNYWSLIGYARMKKLIYERAGVYEFDGTPVGQTPESIVDFFRDPSNGGALNAIKTRLNFKFTPSDSSK